MQHAAIAPATADAAGAGAPPRRADATLWLDGQLVDVSDVESARSTRRCSTTSTRAEAMTADDDGLLPADDLGWVDELDDRAIERAEHWLERKKS